MDKLAEKLIQSHKHPITKLNIDGLKLPAFTGSEEEKNKVENALNSLRTAFSVDRVERRCGRSKCKWLHNENLAQITKLVGGLQQSYGYQNKDGMFLRPEEALFLLEMNKIELLWNDVPLSIQQAYTIILKDQNALRNYRAYRSLKLIGYKLHKSEETQKRQLDEKEDSQNKKGCLASSSKILEDAPILVQNTETPAWDYKVRFPESTKKDDVAFYLYINKSDTLDECLRIADKDGPVVTAVASEDDVAFYRFSSVNLPPL